MLLSFLSVLFLSMMTQKQIAASNKIQAKAATPDVTAVITVEILLRRGVDSSSDSVDSEVSVWKRSRMRSEGTSLSNEQIELYTVIPPNKGHFGDGPFVP